MCDLSKSLISQSQKCFQGITHMERMSAFDHYVKRIVRFREQAIAICSCQYLLVAVVTAILVEVVDGVYIYIYIYVYLYIYIHIHIYIYIHINREREREMLPQIDAPLYTYPFMGSAQPYTLRTNFISACSVAVCITLRSYQKCSGFACCVSY